MNIGIILPTLELTQLAFESITTINREITSGSPYDYRIFFENLSQRCVIPRCATMNISEIWHYDGLLITTTLANTQLALKTTGKIRRVFLVWDLEWLRGQNNYLENLQIYRHPDLMLIARSQEHADAIQHYCNRRVNGIMPELSFMELANAIQ